MQQIYVEIIYNVLCKDTIGIKHSVDEVLNFCFSVAIWYSLVFAHAINLEWNATNNYVQCAK